MRYKVNIRSMIIMSLTEGQGFLACPFCMDCVIIIERIVIRDVNLWQVKHKTVL